MRFAFLGFIIMFSLVVHAQEADCETETEKELKPMIAVAAVAVDATEEPACPNPKKLRGLCMYVGSKEKDTQMNSRKYVWGYQRRLFEAACVDINKDSDAVIASKVQKAWNENEAMLKCKSTQFDITDGSILKYAVNMKFEEFLIDAVRWNIELNKVDQADGATVLDYIKMQIERNKGLPSEPYLKSYYDMLKKAGAKHKSEL